MLQGDGFGGFRGQLPGQGLGGGRGGRVDDGAPQCVLGATLLPATVLDHQSVRCTAVPAAEESGAAAAFDAALTGGAVPSRLAVGGVASAVAEKWTGGALVRGYMRLTASEAAGAGGAVLLWPELANTSGCEPPLGGCRYVVRASARARPRLQVWSAFLRLRLGLALGFSFSFGTLEAEGAANATESAAVAAARLGEWGGGDGLRLQWRADTEAATAAADASAAVAAVGDTQVAAATSTTEEVASMAAAAAAAAAVGNVSLTVVYNMEKLRTVQVPAAALLASADGFAPVAVRYDGGGLSVTHGGAALVTAMLIPGWDPQPGWRLGLGARAVVSEDGGAKAADQCGVRGLSFRGGAAFAAQPVHVSFTLNNQDLASPVPAHRFSYTAPRVSAIVPSSGPADGGLVLTVQGSGFDGGWAYACRFGAGTTATANLSADATALHCISPARTGTEMLAVEASHRPLVLAAAP